MSNSFRFDLRSIVRSRIGVRAIFCSVAIAGALLWSMHIYPFSYMWLSAEAKELNRFFSDTAGSVADGSNPKISASQISPFRNYDKFCFMHPYAIRVSGVSYEEFFHDRFSGVDVTRQKGRIIKRYGGDNDYVWEFYPVKLNKIENELKVYRTFLAVERGLRAGCYKTSSICFKKSDRHSGVLIGYCK